MRLICSDNEEQNFRNIQRAQDPCTITVIRETPTGCPVFRINSLFRFLSQYSDFIAPVIIVIGLLFLLVGGYFKKVSIFVIVLISSIFVVTFILYAFILPAKTPDWVGWVVLFGSAAAGIIAAALTVTFIKLGVFLVGCWLGGTLATCLFQMFIHLISSKPFVLWIIIAVLALAFGLLSLKFLKFVMVVGTSFIGAFLVIRGIASFLGGYPNEFQLFNEIQAGQVDNVPWEVYIYIASMFVISLLGMLFQHKRFKIFKGGMNPSSYQKIED